jgi:hypothetical protein
MGEYGVGGRTPRDIRRLGAHPERIPVQVGSEFLGTRRKKPRVAVSFFDSPPTLTARPEPTTPKPDTAPAIRGGADYFKGRELPMDVWAPPGIVYYERLEDIPPVLRPKTDIRPNMDDWETKGAVGLKVFPLRGDESPDASFKIVGERGLYVRVIVGETEETADGTTRKKQIVRWMHFNEENAAFKDLRFV